jgi:hypothetical protein
VVVLAAVILLAMFDQIPVVCLDGFKLLNSDKGVSGMTTDSILQVVLAIS